MVNEKPTQDETQADAGPAPRPDGPMDRRKLLKMGALGAFFAGGFTAALEPLRHLDNDTDLAAFMQQQ